MEVARPLHEALALLDLHPVTGRPLPTVSPPLRSAGAALLELVLQGRIAIAATITVLRREALRVESLDEVLNELVVSPVAPTLEWIRRLSIDAHAGALRRLPHGKAALTERGELVDKLRGILFDRRIAGPRLLMTMGLISAVRMEAVIFGPDHVRARARERDLLSHLPPEAPPTVALASVASALQTVLWS